MLLRTTDVGQNFATAPAPPTTLALDEEQPEQVSNLRFAPGGQHGWAFGPSLWTTHDGARSWHRLEIGGGVVQLAATGRTVWALTAQCTTSGCQSYRLLRSPVGKDAFVPVRLPASLRGPSPKPDLTVLGSTVAVLDLTDRGASHGRLLVSTDAGEHFATRPAPCLVDLGGKVQAVPGAVWATCRTGTMARVWRSTDDGRTFAAVQTPTGLPNSAVLGAADARLAVLDLGAEGSSLSTDGGGHWQRVRSGAGTNGPALFVGFTSTEVGYLITPGTPANHLMRTTDGGRVWVTVRFG